MKQNLRKQVFIKQSKGYVPKIVRLFSAEEIRRVFEEEERSSEHRFDLIASPVAIQTISQATRDFKSRRGLEVTVTKKSEEIPDIHRSTCFKYSTTSDYSSLKECSARIKNGENITVVLVREEGLLVGYGIAVTKDDECEIEIIDVDIYSRREAGLADTIQLSDQSFQVGVGHVVVNTLIKSCSQSIIVDATNNNSRYIFKSLGFTHDNKSNNPCILKMSDNEV